MSQQDLLQDTQADLLFFVHRVSCPTSHMMHQATRINGWPTRSRQTLLGNLLRGGRGTPEFLTGGVRRQIPILICFLLNKRVRICSFLFSGCPTSHTMPIPLNGWPTRSRQTLLGNLLRGGRGTPEFLTGGVRLTIHMRICSS